MKLSDLQQLKALFDRHYEERIPLVRWSRAADPVFWPDEMERDDFEARRKLSFDEWLTLSAALIEERRRSRK